VNLGIILRDLFDIFGVYLAESLRRIFGTARALIFGSLLPGGQKEPKAMEEPALLTARRFDRDCIRSTSHFSLTLN
jgi:hypothetical protein